MSRKAAPGRSETATHESGVCSACPPLFCVIFRDLKCQITILLRRALIQDGLYVNYFHGRFNPALGTR